MLRPLITSLHIKKTSVDNLETRIVLCYSPVTLTAAGLLRCGTICPWAVQGPCQSTAQEGRLPEWGGVGACERSRLDAQPSEPVASETAVRPLAHRAFQLVLTDAPVVLRRQRSVEWGKLKEGPWCLAPLLASFAAWVNLSPSLSPSPLPHYSHNTPCVLTFQAVIRFHWRSSSHAWKCSLTSLSTPGAEEGLGSIWWWNELKALHASFWSNLNFHIRADGVSFSSCSFEGRASTPLA